MKAAVFFVLSFIPALLQAQAFSYNQYNAVLAELNPAYTAHLEKDYVGLVGRLQMPGSLHRGEMASFTFNKSVDRINSSFGLTAGALMYNQHNLVKNHIGLQYGYKVVLLNDFLLSTGVSVNLLNESADIPTPTIDDVLLQKYSGKNLYANYGIIVQPYRAYTGWYAGFAVRSHLIAVLPGSNLKRKPVFALQLMKNFRLTRKLTLYGFFAAEQQGKISGWRHYPVHRSFTSLFLQGNFIYANNFTFGLGYKYFTSHYGSVHYRIGYTTGQHKKNPTRAPQQFTIGLSFDVKPYIQNDRIHSFQSYEIFFKYKIPSFDQH